MDTMPSPAGGVLPAPSRANRAPGSTPSFKKTLLLSTLLASSLIVAGCGGDDGKRGAAGAPGADGAPGTPGAPGADGNPAFPPATIFVASNGNGDTSIRVRDESLALLNSYNTGGNEGIVVNAAHRLTQAQDATAPSSLITACNAATRSSGDATFTLAGGNTGLSSPKGIELIQEHGLVVVANVGANNLLVFGSAAIGDQAPVATVSLGSNAWDSVYDAEGDRLYVAQTDGSVAVFDQFSSDLGQTVTPRIFTASTAGATTNFHGIDYDATGDRLVVSDVGSAADPADGSLYVFENASTATGSVTPSVTIAGANTLLGNPVDLQLDGGDVRIAEKSNDAILIYRNIFESSGGDLAADVVFATTKPESLLVMPEQTPIAGSTDIADPTTPYRLLSTSNPAAGSPTSGQLLVTSRNLGSPSTAFDTNSIPGLTGLENVVLDRAGDAYVNFDAGSDPGIAVISAIGARQGDSFNPSRDRVIQGANTTLATPKGLEIADDLGLLMVSDTTVGSVLVFSTCDSGNVAPAASLGGTGTPWDTDYAPALDALFVALTNGTVDVYDNFSQTLGAGGPSRTITPTTGGLPFPAPTNLHSARYDQRSDTLILADVGSGAVATDGALLTIENASTASGETEVGKLVAGLTTMLGNPVDIAFDGVDLYVAEKANGGGALQVWRNFLTDNSLTGNAAPSDSVATPNPESLVLLQ